MLHPDVLLLLCNIGIVGVNNAVEGAEYICAFKCVWSGFLGCVCDLISLSLWLLLRLLICGLVWVLFLSSHNLQLIFQ